MSANRDRDTKPELTLRRALWSKNMRGYRLHRRIKAGSAPNQAGVATSGRSSGSLSVRPDISYVNKKLALFVHGCFWHRCPKCDYKLPKTNTEFWKQKFERNIARDESKRIALESLGWTVMTVWECDLKEELSEVIYG